MSCRLDILIKPEESKGLKCWANNFGFHGHLCSFYNAI